MPDKIIDTLKAAAASRNTDDGSFEGAFDDHLLMRMTQDIPDPAGVLFVEGEYVLVEPERDDDAGDLIAFSSRANEWSALPSDYFEAVDQDIEVPEKRFEVLMANVGNPDFNQDPERPMWGTESDFWVPVADAKEASRAVRDYIGEFDLGGGNWSGGQVRCAISKIQIARISYNGRLWKANPEPFEKFDGRQWSSASEELLELPVEVIASTVPGM